MLNAWIKKFNIAEGETFFISGLEDYKFKVIENTLLQKEYGEKDWELCCLPIYELAKRIPVLYDEDIKFVLEASYYWLKDYCSRHKVKSIADTLEPRGTKGAVFTNYEFVEDFFYEDYNSWEDLRVIECSEDDVIRIFGRN